MFNPKHNLLDEQMMTSGLEMNIVGAIGGILLVGHHGFSTASKANSAAKKAQKEQEKLAKEQANITNEYNKEAF